jgi:hypothetical protein
MFRATGRFITMSHIRWLYDNDCQLHRTAVEMDGSTSAGNLLQFLKESKDITYCVLGDVFDHSSCQSVVVNETVVDHSQEAETVVPEDHGFNELSSFPRQHWNAYQLDLQDNIFVGVVWVIVVIFDSSSCSLLLLKWMIQVIPIMRSRHI